MPQASNLQKLAGRPADHPRRGVTDFIEANEDVIRAAISRQHSWTAIFEEAVKDGCPTISVRYFTRAAKSVLGLETREDNSSRSDSARRAAEGAVPQRLPASGQSQSRKIVSAASTRNPDTTEPSPSSFASGVEMPVAEAPAGGTSIHSVPTRQLSQPRKPEPGNSWDSAAPGQRAMLLKDAE